MDVSTMTFGGEHKQCFHIYALYASRCRLARELEDAGFDPFPKKSEQLFL